jgi:hypothetical protein
MSISEYRDYHRRVAARLRAAAATGPFAGTTEQLLARAKQHERLAEVQPSGQDWRTGGIWLREAAD